MTAPQRSPILFVIGTLQVGGTELHLASLAAELVSRGWKVAIYSMSGDGPLHEMLSKRGVEVILPPIHRDGQWAALPRRLGIFTIVMSHLLFVMVKRRPGIVHFFLPMAYLAGSPLAILARRPIRIMSRRSLNRYQKELPGAAFMERRLHRFMTAILGNSRRVVSELLAEGVPSERIGLIYNGLNPERATRKVARNETRAMLGIPNTALIMTVLANLIPYKGHLDLIYALSNAATDLPAGWQLLIVGRDDGIGHSIKALAEEKEISGHIHFLGARDDVSDLLAASDIGLLPSHEEGFSNAILEMMAAELPVIATNVGGNSEAVIDGETGFIVPAHDPATLGRAICRLATDPDMRSRFGIAGRERVSAHFSLETSVTNYVALYRGLLGGKSPRDIEGVRLADSSATSPSVRAKPRT